MAIMSWLSCPGYHVLAIMSWLSCHRCVKSCSVISVTSYFSCHGCFNNIAILSKLCILSWGSFHVKSVTYRKNTEVTILETDDTSTIVGLIRNHYIPSLSSLWPLVDAALAFYFSRIDTNEHPISAKMKQFYQCEVIEIFVAEN